MFLRPSVRLFLGLSYSVIALALIVSLIFEPLETIKTASEALTGFGLYLVGLMVLFSPLILVDWGINKLGIYLNKRRRRSKPDEPGHA